MKKIENSKFKWNFHWNLLLIFPLILLSCNPVDKQIIPITSDDNETIYLPFINNGVLQPPLPPTNEPLIHIPYKNTTDFVGDAFPEMAVFWFGEITNNNNYYDVRIGYGNDALYVYIAAIDRLLWYDNTPLTMNLDEWDSISLFITPSNTTQLLPNQGFLLSSGLAPQEANRSQYQKTFRWDGSKWSTVQIPFTTTAAWRGPGMNDANDDDGWNLSYKIPFSSLGITTAPDPNSIWRMGIIAYDRDYLDGPTISPMVWPPDFDPANAQNWGNISFGLLPDGIRSGSIQGSILVREGENGFIVQDASPGGFTVCGGHDLTNVWTDWGTKVHVGENAMTANIQNQRDIADWPCYSKYYINFPIPTISQNTSIIRATLKLHLYGNAGKWGDPVFQPYRSLIQVGITKNNWSEDALNWNNAPILMENLSRTWVNPMEAFSGWPGIPYEWDVTKAAQLAIENGDNSVSLAVYSADGAYHSGKYFSTSEVEDWNKVARPTLIIEYGNP
ncbi:MAG: DNRLRE domain-containing protein [Anaerolineaceae bacterium]